uniref:DUF3667 domain-containing protein n=1 Tax=Roseihalotalea indica TaxID=2867963 RepID=A0AA49JIY3_9BACT|nr:DUF3667 domain-containing protein [Tunicatimonas sp. TK19036]
MKIRRKTQQCLNCGLTLNAVYNFCPRCGQENNDNNVSFGTFVREFFANYFSFDTRFAHSITPFLIKPGYLTNRFNEGQRVNYVHPLRLYIIISVLFFFLATWLVKASLAEVSIDRISSPEMQTQADSIQQSLGFQQVMAILENESLSDQEAIDSLDQMDFITLDSTRLATSIFHQVRRVAKNDLDVFAGFVLQNMPIMMFILIPLFAFLLKVFYIRRKNPLYVQHLTHALHLHAFMLFLLSFLLMLYIIFDINETVSIWTNLIVSLLMIVYVFFSFLRVYQQNWFKTSIKLFFIISVYCWVLFFFGLSEAMISFMLF